MTKMRVRFDPGTDGPRNSVAIILIGFQNEFVRANGKLHKDVEPIMEETGMLNKVPQVVNSAR